MNILRRIFGSSRKAADVDEPVRRVQPRATRGGAVSGDPHTARTPHNDLPDISEVPDKSTMAMIRDINAKMATEADAQPAQPPAQAPAQADAAPAPSIWDLEDDAPEAAAVSAPRVSPQAPAPQAPEAALETPKSSARARRTKTRLIGFDKSDGSSVDALAGLAPPQQDVVEPAAPVTFAVGWILVVKGHGRGEAFPLVSGLSSIGRGIDQTVRLDFGDATISRSGHAAIAYDHDTRTYTLGHGSKANIVRLNDKPVISNEPITDGDHIRIGETTLRVVTLCDDKFDWSDYEDQEGEEDVAIA